METKETLTDFMELLTGEEVSIIERRHGKGMETLSGTQLLVSAVWIGERRGNPKTSYADIEKWTLRSLKDYFADEDVAALDGGADFPESA